MMRKFDTKLYFTDLIRAAAVVHGILHYSARDIGCFSYVLHLASELQALFRIVCDHRTEVHCGVAITTS